MLPILGIYSFEKTEESVDKTLNFFQCWGNREAIVDTSAIPIDSTVKPSLFRNECGLIPLIFQELTYYNHSFIPSVNLDQQNKHVFFQDLYRKGGFDKLCIRIQEMDIRNYQNLNNSIKQLIQKIGISSQKVYLVLDFGFVDSANFHRYCDLSREVLTRIQNKDDFGDVVLLSSSFSMKGIPMNCKPARKLPRLEVDLWEMAKNYDHLLKYGDYGIVEHSHPADANFKSGRYISPKIRRSTWSAYWIAKGNTGKRKQQYPTLARGILQSCDNFSNLSWGDRRLVECSRGISVSGNLGDWVAIDMNHHMHHTVKQQESIRKKKPINSRKILPSGFLKGTYPQG